jgi:epoxide hydrolase 4
VRAAGVTLHVAIAGTGRPIILLHGFPENWRSWQHQFAPLVSAGFSVWAPDLRGYNGSDRPAERAAYHIEQLTGDVAALVRATGSSRANLAGHDWGGVIAWTFAARFPDLVDRLVILNAPHPARYARKVLHPRQLFKSWYVLAFLVPGLAERLLAARDGAVLRRLFERSPAGPGAFESDRIDFYVRAMTAPGALTAALNYYRANAGIRSFLPHVQPVPHETLVIWGEKDQALSTVLLDGLDKVAPRSRIHRFPGVGHWVNNEVPAEVSELMTRFFTSHGEHGVL